MSKPSFLIVAPPYTNKSAGAWLMHFLCDRLNALGYDSRMVPLVKRMKRRRLAQIAVGRIADAVAKKLTFAAEDSTPKQSFLVIAPFRMNKSVRTWVTYFLRRRQSTLGHTSYLVPSVSFQTHPDFDTPIASQIDDDTIVIYPEIICGNPLKAKRVVRYLLNYDGALAGQKIEWGNRDFPLSFSSVYRDDCDILFYPTVDLDFFYTDGRPRAGSCFYRGKSTYTGPIQHAYNIEITRTFPADKQELGDIFRSHRLLISLDSYSSTNLDAALCGCVPLLLLQNPKVAELGKFWAHSMSEVDDTLREIETLRERVVSFQTSFDNRLDETVGKIIHHFERD